MRNLLSLPTELISSILSYLQCQDLLTCLLLCKQIYRLITDSSLFQYTITLYKYRFLDIVPSSQNIPFSTRLRVLKQREEAWKKLEWKGRHTLKLPPTGSVYEFVGGIYGNGREDDNRVTASISFLELPLASGECGEGSESRNDGEEGEKSLLRTWTHAMGDVAIIDFTMDPSQNLLVLVALAPPDSKYVYNLHLRTISTNQPHPKAPLPILPCLERHPTAMTTPELFTAVRVQVSGDLVGLLIKDAPDNIGAHLEIWNWYSDPHYSCSMSSVAGIDDFTFLSHSAFLLVLPIGRFEVYSFPDPLTSHFPVTNATAGASSSKTSSVPNSSSTKIQTTHGTSIGSFSGTTNDTISLELLTSTSPFLTDSSPWMNERLPRLGNVHDTVPSSSCKNHRGCRPIKLYAYDFPELSNGYMYWYISMSCNPAPGYVPRSGSGSSGNMKKSIGTSAESGIKSTGENENEDNPFPPYNSHAHTLFQRQSQSQSQTNSQSQSSVNSSSSSSSLGYEDEDRRRERRKKENQRQIYYPLPDERIHACCVYIFNPNQQGPGGHNGHAHAHAHAPAPGAAVGLGVNANANVDSDGTTGTNISTGSTPTPVAVASTTVSGGASVVAGDTAKTTSLNGNSNSGIAVSISNIPTPAISTPATTSSSTHNHSGPNPTSTSNGSGQGVEEEEEEEEVDDGLDEDNNQVHSFVFFLNLKMLLHPPEQWINWKEVQRMKEKKVEEEWQQKIRERDVKFRERERKEKERDREREKVPEDLFADFKKSLGPLWNNSNSNSNSRSNSNSNSNSPTRISTRTSSNSSTPPIMTYAGAVSSRLETRSSNKSKVKETNDNSGYVNVQNGKNNGAVKVPVRSVDHDFLPPISSSSSSSSSSTLTNGSTYTYVPFPKLTGPPSTVASGSGNGSGSGSGSGVRNMEASENGNNIIPNRNTKSRSQQAPIHIVDESAYGSQGQGYNYTEHSSTIPSRRSRSGSGSHSQACSPSSSGTFASDPGPSSGSGSGNLEYTSSSSSSSSLSKLNNNNNNNNNSASPSIRHSHTSFTFNNQLQPTPSSSLPPPPLIPHSPHYSNSYFEPSEAWIRAQLPKSNNNNTFPIPWDVWGPTSTRWFEECLSTDWQHAIYGLRTVESVSIRERQRAIEKERMRIRVQELKQQKDMEEEKIRRLKELEMREREMRETGYEFDRIDYDVIMGGTEMRDRKSLIDFEGKEWKTVTTKRRSVEQESSQYDDHEDNNEDPVLGYEVDNEHNIVYLVPPPSSSITVSNTNGQSLPSTSNHPIDVHATPRTTGRRRPKRFLRVRDFNPHIIAETEAEIQRYEMLRVKEKPSRVHIENGGEKGKGKWKGKQRATPLYPISTSPIPIHLNINTNITSPPPTSSPPSSSSPSSLLRNQNQKSSLPNGQIPYSVSSSSGITSSPSTGNSSTTVFGMGTGNISSYIPPPSSSSSSIPISTLPLTDVSGENGYSIPILPYSNNASLSSPLLSPQLTLSTTANGNRISTVRKHENPKPKVWSKRRVVREPSTTPVNGVFKKDIISLLPYAEVVSEETFEVTDVMMDDCRLLLLKRGQMGKLESVEVLMM